MFILRVRIIYIYTYIYKVFNRNRTLYTGSIVIYIYYVKPRVRLYGIRDPIENDAKKIKDPGNLVPIRVVLYF